MGDLIFKPASGGDLILQQESSETALKIDTDGNTEIAQNIEQADGKNIQTDEIRARDGDGLKIYDDSGTQGFFVRDGGNCDIGGASHDSRRLSIKGTANDNSENTLEIFNSDNNQLFKVVSDGSVMLPAGVYVGTTGANLDRKLSLASTGTSPVSLYWGNEKLFEASDRRIKKDITDTEIDGLGKINALRVRDFSWNDPTDIGDDYNKRGQWTGMIAQEIIDVLPFTINAPRDKETNETIEDAVSDEDNQIIPWIVNYGYMVPVLVKAIQELSAKVTALENA